MIRRFSCRLATIAVLFCLTSVLALATHQKAAELIVEHVSGYTYRAKLYTYTFTQSPVDRPEMEIFWGDGTSGILTRSREEMLGNDTKLNYYEGEHTYSGPGSYTLYMEDPNRNSGVVNVPNSVMTSMYISTLITISPWLGEGNNSPVTTRSPVDDNACLGQTFIHNPAAYDPDGDLLTYKLIPCRTVAGEDVPGYTYPAASDTFYLEPHTGNLVWNAPMAQGEYNVALLIEEWRNQMKIGDLTRDMQIIVRACDNTPPYIQAQDFVCVEAGSRLFIPVTVLDQDGDRLSLEASGELFQGGRSVGLQKIHSTVDTALYGFYWDTEMEDSRDLPYRLYLRAEDDGDPHLSSVRVVSIKVMAPAVAFTRAEAERTAIGLSWNRTPSPHAVSYMLYRRDFSAEESAYDSCQTGLADSSYRFLVSLPVTDTSYTDYTVEEGREYCYRTVVGFPDGSLSRRSDPVCLQMANFAPLITRVSVEETDVYQGKNRVCWRAPEDVDSSLVGDWTYHLYSGPDSDSLEWVADIPFDTCVCYPDSILNTEKIRYFYRVSLDTLSGSAVSSVYLTAVGKPGRVELRWIYDQPWKQLAFLIYRCLEDSAFFAVVDTVYQDSYVDRNVEAGRTYAYYVEAIGSYASARFPQLLRNKSNRVEAKVLEMEPCKPYLFLLHSSCNPLSNTLAWDFDSLYDPSASPVGGLFSMDAEEREECGQSVSYYELYRKKSTEKEYRWLATVQEQEYEDTEPGSLFCSYRVVGISSQEKEGPSSNELLVDNWHCFAYELPNVFTPNSDGINDVWRAKDPRFVEIFEIRVVNRWGVEVFRSTDPLFEWNGKLGNTGKDCPDGPYFYFAQFKVQVDGRVLKKEQSGSVTILR